MGVEQSAIRESFTASENVVGGGQCGFLADQLKGARSQIIKKIQNFEATLRHDITPIYTGDFHMTNKIINIGSGATIIAPITIADTIENSFNQVAQSGQTDEVKKLFEALMQQVAVTADRLPADKTKVLSQDVETLGKELALEAPRRKWYELSLEGIKSAAEAVGEVGTPLIKTAAKLLPLLISLFP